jgi:hypothetical protein
LLPKIFKSASEGFEYSGGEIFVCLKFVLKRKTNLGREEDCLVQSAALSLLILKAFQAI